MTAHRYIPRRCVFEATLSCNLRCRHCGSMAGRARKDELSTDEARDLFQQLAELGCERITISGGEPMCRKDWPDLIEAAAKTGMKVGMITNAVAFDDAAARCARDKGLTAVGFSVDGPRATHDFIRGKVGHFGLLSSAMDASVGAGLKFAVVSFVNTRNIDKLDEMYNYIRDKGAFAWQIQLGTDMGNLSDHRDLLIDAKQLPRLEETLSRLVQKKGLRVDVADSVGYFGPHEKTLRASQKKRCFNGCPAGINVVGIESNGNVKGCLSIMAGYNPRGAEFVEGNIREARLADIWHRPGAFAYNREWSIESLSGFCRDCSHAKQCRGGCRAKMTASGGGVENPMCIHRVAVEEGLYRHYRAPYAAALMASVLGMAGCRKADNPVPVYGAPMDTNADTDLDTGIDTEADTSSEVTTDTGESESDTPAYSMPLDTDSAEPTDTSGVDEYGIFIDTETLNDVPEYGIPVDKDTAEPFDTFGVDEYGIFIDTETDTVPVYGAPLDTDTTVPPDTDTTFADAYGIPFDEDGGIVTPPDSDVDTSGVDEYGIFIDTDTVGVPEYAMPVDSDTAEPFDTSGVDEYGIFIDTDTDTDTAPPQDTNGIDVYGMPAFSKDDDN